MIRLLRSIIPALALVGAVGVSAMPVSALAPKEAVIECDLNGLLGKLAQLKADSSTSSVQAELDLRKQILARSMECNAREAGALANAVAELEGASRVSNSLKKRYETALDQAAAYASAQAAEAAALDSVTSTKERAVALKAWRTETYNPLAWEASQLVVLDRNLGLAASGKERLKQLMNGVADVEDAEGSDAVRGNLTEAATLINDADEDLNAALVLLRDTPKTSQEAITSAQKAGLDELSRAYRLLLVGNEKLSAIPTE